MPIEYWAIEYNPTSPYPWHVETLNEALCKFSAACFEQRDQYGWFIVGIAKSFREAIETIEVIKATQKELVESN